VRTAGYQQSVKASGGKAFAPLGAARVDDGATTAGRHACPKAMPARALQTAGLESALHFWNLFAVGYGSPDMIEALDTRGE
jgi:hypothetical protein